MAKGSEGKRTKAESAQEAGASVGASVSVRLSKELLEYIDARAAKENRSRSNLIETILKQAVEQA